MGRMPDDVTPVVDNDDIGEIRFDAGTGADNVTVLSQFTTTQVTLNGGAVPTASPTAPDPSTSAAAAMTRSRLATASSTRCTATRAPSTAGEPRR